jgi:CheY-like chemotaxis protein
MDEWRDYIPIEMIDSTTSEGGITRHTRGRVACSTTSHVCSSSTTKHKCGVSSSASSAVFTVESEADGMVALRRIAEGPPFDAILCDRYLAPGVMSGDDFFESLPVELQVRTIMCSGAEPDEHDAFAAALGDRFLLKPVSVPALVSILLRVARVPPQAAA